MDIQTSMTLVMIPASDLESIKATQIEILNQLRNLPKKQNGQPSSEYISASDYMKAVNIKRTKFYGLIANGKIRTLKKCRKIYVHSSEVNRFFMDPSVK